MSYPEESGGIGPVAKYLTAGPTGLEEEGKLLVYGGYS
jgi:hypothetical protein